MGTPNEGINGTLGTNLKGHYPFDSNVTADSSGNNNNLLIISGTPSVVADSEGIGQKLKLSMGDRVESQKIPNTIDKGTTISIWFDYVSGSPRNILGLEWFKADNQPAGEVELIDIPLSDGIIRTNFGAEIIGNAISGLNNLIITTGNFEAPSPDVYVNGVKHQGYGFSLPPDNWETVQFYMEKAIGGEFDYNDEIRLYDGVLTEAQCLEIFEMGVNYNPSTIFNPLYPSRGANRYDTSLNSCLNAIGTKLGLTLTLPAFNDNNWDVTILTALSVIESNLKTQLDKPKRDDKNWDVKLNRCLSKIINVINGAE